jgi:Adenomatosis polyposis coli down-regulated 1
MTRGFLTTLAVVIAFVPSLAAGQAPPDIRGFWEQEACVVQQRDGKKTGSRSLFAFFDGEWGIAFTQFADEACRTRLMTAVLRGTYEAAGPSRVAAGAYEATFRFRYKGLTVFDDALLARVAASCGFGPWRKSEERDVTSRGCLWLEPLAACAQEFDLIALEGRFLYLGERPSAGQNICVPERRPSRLRAVPLVRR